MTKKERILVSKILDYASHMFSLMPCEDIPDSWIEGWSKEEQIRLFEAVDGDDYSELKDIEKPAQYLQTSTLADYLSKKMQ